MDVINAEMNLETAASSMAVHRLKLFADLEDSIILIEALTSDGKTVEKVKTHYTNVLSTLSSKKASLDLQLSELTRLVAELGQELENLRGEDRKLDSQIKIITRGIEEREKLMSVQQGKKQSSISILVLKK